MTRQEKDPRRERQWIPSLPLLEADALPLGQRGGAPRTSRPWIEPLYFMVESYQGLTFGTLAAALPSAWRSRVRARTGWSGVSIL